MAVLFCPNCSIHTKAQLGEMTGFLWQITIRYVKYSRRNRTGKIDVPRYIRTHFICRSRVYSNLCSKYKVNLKTKEYGNKVCCVGFCFFFYQLNYYSFKKRTLVERGILNFPIEMERGLLWKKSTATSRVRCVAGGGT